MKKLMTMIAAVATAFGLYATEGFKAGTCFNDWTDISDRTGDENLTWFASLYESTLINPAGWSFGKTVLPKRWADNDAGKALNVKTVLGTEFVTCAPKPAIELTGDEKIYVDTLVKFTAFDEEAQFGDATAKLAVWIREKYDTDGETIVGTNLYVTAGKIIDKDVNITSENYLVGEYKGGDWCRLTIKSLGSVKGDGTGVYGFVVYIDGKPVSCTTDKGFGYVTLSDLAAYYNANNILFPSLVKGTEISSLAISGQGAIDDIAFTTEAPDFAVDMLKATITLDRVTAAQLGTITVSTNGAGVSGVDLSSGSASIYYKKASTPPTIKVEWTGAGNVLAGNAESSTGALKITESDLTYAKVYIGSKGYATIADALKEATAGDTITLSNAVTEAVTVTKAVTLDLNGKVLTGNITASANLTIANSDASRVLGGKLFNGKLDGDVTMTAGILVVNGGFIDGYINPVDDDHRAVANGGQFTHDFSDPDLCPVVCGTGVSPVKISDDPAIWEVGAFVAQNGEKAYLTLAEAAAEAVAGDTITVLADVNFEENIVFQGEGTNTAAIVFDLNNHTITNASGNNYGIVIADANVTLKNGTYGMNGAYGASLVMVGVNSDAGTAGKPGEKDSGATFTGYLTVENVNITGGTGTSAAIKVEKGTLVVTSGTFENLRGDTCHSIKADGAGAEAILNGGTFERMVEAKNSGKVYVNGGSYKILPNVGDPAGTVIYPEGKKLFKAQGDVYFTLKDITLVTLTIAEKGEGVESLSVTNSAGETVVSGTTFDVDDAETVAAVYTLASGYELDTAASTLEATMTADATIKVVAKRTQSDPVVPGAVITTDKTTDEINADPTLKAQLLKAPGGVETTQAYLNLFTAVAGTEQGTVKFVLTEDAEATLATEVANETKAIEVAKIADGTVTTIAIANATKGLYYTLNAAATLEGIAAVDEVLCTDGTVTFTKGVQGTTSDTARFFKVSVSATPATK